MLLKTLQIPETAVFVQERVLVVSTLVGGSSDQTASRNIFDVNLDSLTGVAHLLIGLGDILGIWQFHRHLSTLSQKTVQVGDGACVASLPQFHPEHHQAGVGVPTAHVLNKLDLLGPVLVRMAMGTVGAVLQRLQRRIVPLAPTVDLLPVCMVADGRLGYSMLLGI